MPPLTQRQAHAVTRDHKTHVLILSDICYDSVRQIDPDHPQRQISLGAELLQRALEDSRRRDDNDIDAVALVGKLVADVARPYAAGDLADLHEIIRQLAGNLPLLIAADPSQEALAASVFGTSDNPMVDPHRLREAGGRIGSLCASPFPYGRFRPADPDTSPDVRQLANDLPGLFDTHVHTELAYCASGVTIEGASKRMHLFGLAGMCFTEHAGQLYVSADDFWNARFIFEPQRWKTGPRDRMDDYLRRTDAYRSDSVLVGLETEVDRDGRLILRDEDRARADVLLGAIHWLNVDPDGLTEAQINAAFLRTAEQLLAADVDVMAHPVRYFFRSASALAPETGDTLARMLAETDTVAEVNFHKNAPPKPFFAACLDRGVKITFGSDAHSLWGMGLFSCYTDFLRRVAGVEDISDLLWRPRGRR